MATINRAAGSDDLAMGGADPRRQVVGTGKITRSAAEEEGERHPPGRKLLQADDRAALPPGRNRPPRWYRRGPSNFQVGYLWTGKPFALPPVDVCWFGCPLCTSPLLHLRPVTTMP